MHDSFLESGKDPQLINRVYCKKRPMKSFLNRIRGSLVERKDFLTQGSQNLLLQATKVSNELKLWQGHDTWTPISIGQNCTTAWYLKIAGKKFESFPFDWVFSSAEIVEDCIKDRFTAFLDRSQMTKNQDGTICHERYHKNFFSHRDPLNDDEDYLYYKRCVERFIGAVELEKSILFVCSVIGEPEKRPGWANGFTRDFEMPTSQTIESFMSLMSSARSGKGKTQFIFIEQHTESCYPSLVLSEITDNWAWISFKASGKNTGSKFSSLIDDLSFTTLFTGL